MQPHPHPTRSSCLPAGALPARLYQRLDCEERNLRYRAGAVSRGKTKAQALPYLEPRVYEYRLSQLVPGDWSVTFDPWGDQRIICRLTIHGVTRRSTVEASDSPNGIAGTSAEAQALKRACAEFGSVATSTSSHQPGPPTTRTRAGSPPLPDPPRLDVGGR